MVVSTFSCKGRVVEDTRRIVVREEGGIFGGWFTARDVVQDIRMTASRGNGTGDAF